MRRLALIASGAAFAVFCSHAAIAQSVPQTTISVPEGVFVKNVAVGATQKVSIGNSTTIQGGTSGAPVVVTNTGSVLTQIGLFTKVQGNISSVAPVWLGAGATVTGDVATNGGAPLALPGQISGTVNTNATLAPPKPFAWDLPSLPSNGDVHLSFLANGSLTPGGYGQVNVDAGSTLTLTAGIYTADRFHIDPLGFVKFDTTNGPIQVYAATTMDIFCGVTTVGSPSNLLLVYGGTNSVTINSPFNGTVVAPNAELELEALGIPFNFAGSYFAQEVDVDPNITLTRVAFNWDSIPQLVGTNGNAIASIANLGLPSPPQYATSPNMSAAFTSTGSGSGYYGNLQLLASDPSKGIVAATFCDANENVVATPTDAQLNAPPPPGSTCAGSAGSVDTCEIDPSTVTTLCTTDSDCTGGAICGVRCLDTACTTVEHRCGTLPASCAGLPPATNCKEYRLCAPPGSVGTTNPAGLAATLTDTTTPDPSATVLPSQRDTVPPTYEALDQGLCVAPTPPPVVMKDASNKPGSDGSSQWGINTSFTTEFGITPVKASNGIGELQDLHGSADAELGATIFGAKVTVLGAKAVATATDCGFNFTVTVKLFGDAIAAFTPNTANKFHFALNPDQSLGSGPSGTACVSARDANKQAFEDVRKSNVFAREVLQYYQNNGITYDLCTEIEQDVPTAPRVNCADYASLSAGNQIDMLNAWNNAYNTHTSEYANFANQLGTARSQLNGSGTVPLFDAAPDHPYRIKPFPDVQIPIAFFTLDLAVEGYGSWNVKGGIQYGYGVDGDITKILQGALTGQPAPQVTDLRVYAGPVVTPSVKAGVLGFAGVGIPGISIGIEGRVDLLDVSVPTGVVAAARRLNQADPRDLSTSPYAGASIAALPQNDYEWVTGFKWGSDLQLSELDGEMDVAARVDLLFFSDDFHIKLFGWNGFTQHFNLLGGGAGSPIISGDNYGLTGDTAAYTQIPAITDNPPNVGGMGPSFPACTPPTPPPPP